MFRFILVLSLIMIFAGCAAKSPIYDQTAKKAIELPTQEAAVEYYKANVKKTVHSHEYYAGLGDIHYKYGSWGEAVNAYTRALRNYSRPEYNLQRGRSYIKLGFYDDAIIDFSSVVDSQGSRMPVAYVERAKAYVGKGDFGSAVKDLDKAKKRGGENADFLTAMTELYYQMGRYDDAKTYVQKAILADANDADLYFIRAKVFYKTKDANQTITDLRKAIELNPNSNEAKRMLAWVYATNPLGQYRNGQEALRISKELYEKNEEMQYVEVLAAAYAENGDFDKAIEVLKEGIRLSTDLVQKEEFRFDIKNYEKEEPVRLW